MSYANMDGVPTQTAGTSEILASDWNTYVRDNFDSIKFGHVVCTSSTRPTGIAEGTMIYETDTNKVLVYDGSSWVEVSDIDSADGLSASAQTKLDAVGLVHIVTQDFSATTTININDCFSADYNNYRIVIYFSTATAGNEARLRMRSAGTDDTTNNYSIVRTANVGGTLAGSQTDSQSVAAWCNYTNGGSSFAVMDISAPFLAAPTLFRSFTTQNVGALIDSYDYAGNHNVSTSYDGISFFAAAGVITGTVRIYGYKN